MKKKMNQGLIDVVDRCIWQGRREKAMWNRKRDVWTVEMKEGRSERIGLRRGSGL